MTVQQLSRSYSSYVLQKTWGPDDNYLVVEPESIQVSELEGWQRGDPVRITVTVEKL